MNFYIPAFIAIVVVIVIIWVAFALIRGAIREKRGQSTCIKCKAAASKITQYPYLFLLPLSFGDTYSDAENYLRAHMTPIMDRRQIPTGKRACKVDVYECPRCNTRQAEITDFLLVRGADCNEGHYKFSYDSFRSVLEAWENMYHQGFSR